MTGELPGNISIFGEGNLQNMLFETFGASPFFEDCSYLTMEETREKIDVMAHNSPLSSGRGVGGEGLEGEKKIYFFGWQSQSVIRDVLQMSHFSLMPSRFLETFGLSALESLSEGVPVIGFRKGGLVPFVSRGCEVPFSHEDRDNIEALSSKMKEAVDEYSSEIVGHEQESSWSVLSHESRRIADTYTEGRWIEQIRDILPEDTKKILLVSDYTTLLGGIETHVQTIAKVLRRHGYEVEIFGWEIKKGRWTKVLRLL